MHLTKLGGPGIEGERGLPKLSPLMGNVALGKGILITKFAEARKQQTLQPGPNYAIRAAAANDENAVARTELCYIDLASSRT